MTATAFAVLAPFVWSSSFVAQFAIPKLIVLAAGVPFMFWRGRIEWNRSLIGSGAVVLGVFGLSAWACADPYLAMVGRHNSYALGMLGLSLCYLYHIGSSSEDPGHLELLALAGSSLGCVAVLEWFGVGHSLAAGMSGARAVGTIGSPTDLGAILALLLPVSWWLNPVLGGFAGLGLVVSGSRGAWVGAAVGMAIYAWRKGHERLVLVAVLALGLAFAAVGAGGRSWGRSDAGRVGIWRLAVKAWSSAPYLGHGPDSFENSFRRYRDAEFAKIEDSDSYIQADAHNDVLQVLATGGTVGLLAYLGLAVMAFRAVRHHPAVLAGLSALFVNAKFNPIPLEGMVLAGVMVGLASNRESKVYEVNPVFWNFARCCMVGLVCIVARLAHADYLADKGYFLKAIERNPWEMSYRSSFVNYTIDAIRADEDGAISPGVTEPALWAGLVGLKMRPATSTAWYTAAMSAKISGKPWEPILERGLLLDPMNRPMLRMVGR